MPLAPGSFSTSGGSGTQGGTTGATTNAIVKATAANTLGDSAVIEASGARLCFGGTSASYGAVKYALVNGALQFVLADNSGAIGLDSSGLYGNTGFIYNAYGGFGANAGASGINGTQLGSAGQYCWGSSGTTFGGFGDTGLGRAAAGVVQVTDGSTGQGALLAKRVITAKTADYTVTAAETGTVFTNTGASGTVVFTLPAAPANGLTYEFHITAAQSVDIQTGTAVLIYANAVATTATTGKLTKNTVGTCIQLVYNGVAWMGVGQSGTWTVS